MGSSSGTFDESDGTGKICGGVEELSPRLHPADEKNLWMRNELLSGGFKSLKCVNCVEHLIIKIRGKSRRVHLPRDYLLPK
jgi:hypothetical protein